ncbi:unnamed protein product [Vicia faba]|uniref:Uncharacterized protein n=1 Tax=Vicia faba TaxID=3906 RepID=A0AAV0YBN7_VICFA|nr:unnamed protein product [Vicia faba]
MREGDSEITDLIPAPMTHRGEETPEKFDDGALSLLCREKGYEDDCREGDETGATMKSVGKWIMRIEIIMRVSCLDLVYLIISKFFIDAWALVSFASMVRIGHKAKSILKI